jgi:hypothetical protein
MRTIEQIIREVNPISPRNIHHPIHREKWLAFAEALGRMEAREEYQELHANDNTKARTD